MGIYTDKRKVTQTPDGYELLMHESGHIEYDFNWHLGAYWSKYIAELRDNGRFMATKCPECGMVYCPPRKVCGKCYVSMDEWVEVGPEGTLQGFTVVRFPYFDPNNGALMKVPFTAIWVSLDGADTRTMHFCDELDEMKLEVGMKMRAVFAKEPRPTSIHAVDYFKVVGPAEKPPVKPAKTAKKKAAKKKAPAGKKAAKKPAGKKAAKKPAKKAPARKKASKKPVKKAPARKKASKKPVKKAAKKAR